ncbi:RecQ family ATP-dependent DNA helicase [Bacteroidales bacterium OttesenSCG-928-C19]|nr:RecQ family ATP-dependent DNA helicase [Bacteroidales bacterium OttesenSCG-928-C19]
MHNIHEILQKYWGYDSFRPLQEDIILSVMNGNDTLALLPTGGGKSVCFQVPGLALEGICIVVSPLIALMKDQVEQLRQRNIPAAAIYSGMNSHEIESMLNQAVYGKLKFLYVSPERLKTKIFIEHFKQMNVALIAVDEAHCISQWGYDFRPPYLEIASIRGFFPNVPVMALTATATPDVIEDIQQKLLFKRNKNVFQKSFYRENLIYMVFKEEDKRGRLLRLVNTVKGVGIIYVRNRRKTEEVSDFLNRNGIRASYYHAGLTAKERELRQNAWMNERTPVIVATNAFGMGIDKPNVRFVVHLDLPESPEAYFQEAGRGGRDGKLSYAVLFYDNLDVEALETNFNQAFPEIKFIRNVYQAVSNYYQIPVGSGADQKYEFDIAEVCRNYNLPILETYNALKFLEKEGLLLLSQKEESTSKIYIPLNKEELYIFQVENAPYDPIIKTLLRSYGGLFTHFVAIKEEELAKRLNTTVTVVEKSLKILHDKQVLVYEKRSKRPQIIFTSNRLPSTDILISDQYYKHLKDIALIRKQAMLEFVKDEEICKGASLLKYFGEKTDMTCGKCNICIEKKKNERKKREKDIEEKLLSIITNQPQSIKEVLNKTGEINEKEVLFVINKLKHSQVIKINELMEIYRIR